MPNVRVVISTANGLQQVEYRDSVTAVVTSRGVEPVAGTDEANVGVLVARANTAIAQNATYLALPSPSAAQVTAQVDRLTRECSALLRLMLARTESLTDS